MHLSALRLLNFRSCEDTTIHLDHELTILAGENNGGKTNVLDAIRLLVAPSDGRRSRVFERDDLRCGADEISIEATFSGLDSCQSGLFFSALSSNAASEALYQLKWAPPTGRLRRRSPTWTVGTGGASELEPDVRDLVRHVHLPALRDAERDLASSSPGRIEFLLRHLINGDEAVEQTLLATARGAFTSMLSLAPLDAAEVGVRDAFRPLAAGFHKHEPRLRFAEPTLLGLARDLRFHLEQEGIDPERMVQSGLGYANLLYLASVLVELDAARDSELTLLLVEEPEAHLHPQLQRATLDFLRKKAAESAGRKSTPGTHAGSVQVIVTTHSPQLTAASPIDRIVILRQRLVQSAGVIQAKETDGTAKSAGAGAAACLATTSVAVQKLAIGAAEKRKIERYLDVTRSALLFARSVLLVEGIAEALLLPVFAELALSVEERERFRSVAIIAIDGVDFAPYVRLLLASPAGSRTPIADCVAVLTDEDPWVDDNDTLDDDTPVSDTNGKSPPAAADRVPAGVVRQRSLDALAEELGARERLTVEITPNTFEAALLGTGNGSEMTQRMEILKKAFLSLSPRSGKAWNTYVESAKPALRAQGLVTLIARSRTRKGDFAQAIAQMIDAARAAVPGSQPFPVPEVFVRVLRTITR